MTPLAHCLCNGGRSHSPTRNTGFVSEHKTIYFAANIVASGISEVRQPWRIDLAGQMGLGEWRDSPIDYRRITLSRFRPPLSLPGPEREAHLRARAMNPV